MLRQLLTRGYHFMYLSMLIATLSGALLIAIPGTASAQITTNPEIDPRCTRTSTGYTCREVYSSTTEEWPPVTTIETCNLGWSSRKATQEVTRTEFYQVDWVLYEDYYPFIIWDTGYMSWGISGTTRVREVTPLDPIIEYGECRPVTGRPPQN